MATSRVFGNPFPKHVQDMGVPVILVDAGPAQFENFAANAFERAEIKELLAEVAEVSLGAIPALHPIRSSQCARGSVVHHQVVADKIKAITIEACPRGTLQPFDYAGRLSVGYAF